MIYKNLIKLKPTILEIVKQLNGRGNQAYIVGGSVRDALLGIEHPKDIDIEVYHISYDDLMTFLSKYGKVDLVGKKFGVIVFTPFNEVLNGSMKYDFSIPRKESKCGVGHTEFNIEFDVNITIQEASARRDFTFNALAYDPINHFVHDFYDGLNDIKNKIIRHTSDAFSEDFLRIIRGMQFQARFGFEIYPDTIALMKEMLSTSNEYNKLSVERVHEEFLKWSEKGVHHDLIFKFMRDTGLIEYYPILKALKETPQDEVFHPEGSVWVHTELCLKQIDRIIKENNITGVEKTILVLSVLLHDVGKPKTTEHQMKNERMTITSHGHEALGGKISLEFLSSLGFPMSIIEPVCNLVANHLAGVSISQISAQSGKVKAVKRLSRRLHPATIQQLLWVMEADSNGRGGTDIKEATGSADIKEIAKDLDVTVNQYKYILMGRHLIEQNLKPSPEFGNILRLSYEAQENGLFNDEETAKEWLSEYLKTWDKQYFNN